MDNEKKLNLREFLETYYGDCAVESLAHYILELTALGNTFAHMPALLIPELSFCTELADAGIIFCAEMPILDGNKVIQNFLVKYTDKFNAKDFINKNLPVKLRVEFFLKEISVNNKQTDILFPYETSFSLLDFSNKCIKNSKIEYVSTRDLSEKLREFLPDIKCHTLCVGF